MITGWNGENVIKVFLKEKIKKNITSIIYNIYSRLEYPDR